MWILSLVYMKHFSQISTQQLIFSPRTDFPYKYLKCPAIDWRPVQGVPCLRPKSAGIGSSPPATLQRIKRCTYNVYRWWMDGWKSGGDYLWESMQILFISNKTGGHKNHFLNSYLTGNQSSHVVQNSHSQAFRKQLEFWFITTLSNKKSSLNIQIITKAQDVGSTVQWIKALRPVALSLLGLDFPPQHLVGDQICLFHIGVSTAHHRTAREQRDGGEINRFKEQQNIQIYSRH